MTKQDQQWYAKHILAEKDINISQKDIESVDIHKVTVIEHEIANGELPPDYFSHREVVLIIMNDGTRYKVLRETVDKNGNFSTNSAKMITQSVEKE